jgi:hypothetical protein
VPAALGSRWSLTTRRGISWSTLPGRSWTRTTSAQLTGADSASVSARYAGDGPRPVRTPLLLATFADMRFGELAGLRRGQLAPPDRARNGHGAGSTHPEDRQLSLAWAGTVERATGIEPA